MEVHSGEDGNQTYNFATNNIEIRYDLYVADFVILQSTSSDLNLQICVPPEDRESSQEHLEMLKKIAGIYAETFGPLPFGKISYISAKEYSFNASGGPLAISNRNSFLTMADSGYYLLAHEVAHNYWGHTVMGNGPDLALLSEAFADYSAYHAIREIHSEQGYSNYLSYAAVKYFREMSKAEKSISVADVLTNLELDHPISSVVRYHKGSWLLAMLENYLGKAQFHKAVQAYAAFYGREGIYPDFAGFISIVEQETGEDLGWFMDGWYKGAGEPEFTLNNLEWNGEGSLLLQLAMDNFTTSLPVEIGINTEKEELLQVHWVNPGENSISIPLDSPPLEVEIDPRMRILKSPNNIEYSGHGSHNKLIFSIP